ncbi:MAG: hypothetical protein CMH56_17170 [Myxococcales bacterium]|nr:hypothetical protein [Myxococcales bacterium]
MSKLIAVLGLNILLFCPTSQARPTEGGLFGFSDSDTVVFYDTDEGNVRVHYSESGPNVTVLDDNDQDGVPDFVQNLGDIAEMVLETFHQELGFFMPIADDTLYIENGGSSAFDFYLVDFDGAGDGHFGMDGCFQDSPACIGHMVIENDFAGYGYSSLYTALEVVVSHELFHAVQAAYRGDLPIWVSEGTAVWAEKQYDPDSYDFLAWASNYLEETSRSLNHPPTGPVPPFAYSTSLFWDFLSTRHGSVLIQDYFESSVVFEELSDDDWLSLLDDELQTKDDSLADAFFTFAQWNLGTGDRAGEMNNYAYAQSLNGLVIENYGDTIDDSIRLFPMATQYFRLNHSGGPIAVLLEEELADLAISLHPVSGGALDGPVLGATATMPSVAGNAVVTFNDEADFDAGGYFLALVRTHYEGESSRIRFCAGSPTNVSLCQLEEETPQEPIEAAAPSTDEDAATPFGCHATRPDLTWLGFGLLLLGRRQKKRRPEGRLF